jgi:hypothetical protein
MEGRDLGGTLGRDSRRNWECRRFVRATLTFELGDTAKGCFVLGLNLGDLTFEFVNPFFRFMTRGGSRLPIADTTSLLAPCGELILRHGNSRLVAGLPLDAPKRGHLGAFELLRLVEAEAFRILTRIVVAFASA